MISESNQKKRTSIKRELELMLLWVMQIGKRVPRNVCIEAVFEDLCHQLTDAIQYSQIALRTKDCGERLRVIDALIFNMAASKSIIQEIFEYSSSSNIRIISIHQHADYLVMMESLSRMIGAWRKSTEESVASGEPQHNSNNITI